MSSELHFSVIGQNVNGLSNTKKRDKIFMRLKSKADIIFLQETHTTSSAEKKFENNFSNFEFIFSHGTSNSRGVMILLNSTLEYEIHNTIKDPMGRYIFAHVTIQGHKCLLVNVYAPTESEKKNVEFLTEIIDTFTHYNDTDFNSIIMQGDWNFTETIDLDRMGGNPVLWKKSLEKITELKNTLELVDCWRHHNLNKKQFTFSRDGKSSRIDRFYVSETLLYALKSEIVPGDLLADHSPVRIEIKIFKKGPGMWRLNTSLLEDPVFCNDLKIIINEAKLSQNSDKRTHFDFIKYKVKEFSLRRSKEIAKANRQDMKQLENSIKIAEERLQTEPNNHSLQEKLFDAKSALDNHYNRIHRGLVLQSRVQYYEEGEKCTRFFLNSIKRDAAKSTIRQLKLNETSPIIDDQPSVMNELYTFYKDLYTSKRDPYNIQNNEAQQWIQDLKIRGLIPQLSDEDKEFLKKEPDIADLEDSLKATEPNKSPGNDGLPYEFYKKFWSDIKDPLMESLREGLSEGKLSTSQRQSIIRLIPKKGKSPIFVKNWRPLNQSNCDQKLLAKFLALFFYYV